MHVTKLLLCATGLLCGWGALAKTATQGAQSTSGAASSVPAVPEATNLWQQQPKTPKPMPAVVESPEYNRQARRNAYADKIYGPHIPFEELARRGATYRVADRETPPRGRPPVPPSHPNELVGVGSFESFDVVLTPSHESIYTEMHIRLEKVISCNFASCPSPASTIDILVPGGTAQMPDGTRLSFLTEPHPYGLSPKRRYVLFLRHVPEGAFYLLDKSIDITAGYAVPNDPDDAIADRKGTWPFRQMSESGLVSAIADKLNAQKAP